MFVFRSIASSSFYNVAQRIVHIISSIAMLCALLSSLHTDIASAFSFGNHGNPFCGIHNAQLPSLKSSSLGRISAGEFRRQHSITSPLFLLSPPSASAGAYSDVDGDCRPSVHQLSYQRITQNHRSLSCLGATAPSAGSTSGKADRENNDAPSSHVEASHDTEDTPAVSDAEALLACWSYLQHRNKIGGWTKHQQRKLKRQQILAMEYPYDVVFLVGEDQRNTDATGVDESEDDGDDDGDDDDGYHEAYKFEHQYMSQTSLTPNELGNQRTYLDHDESGGDGVAEVSYPRTSFSMESITGDTIGTNEAAFNVDTGTGTGTDYGRYINDDNASGMEKDGDVNIDVDMETTTAVPPYYSDENGDDSANPQQIEPIPTRTRMASMDNHFSGAFVSFPTSPTESHVRRSKAAKLTWSNPDFRSHWYEQRWGEKARIGAQNDQSNQNGSPQRYVRDSKGHLRVPGLARMPTSTTSGNGYTVDDWEGANGNNGDKNSNDDGDSTTIDDDVDRTVTTNDGEYKNRQLLERVRALPSGFVGSQELASMTEEEISFAIRSYVSANKKRAFSHSKRWREIAAKKKNGNRLLMKKKSKVKDGARSGASLPGNATDNPADDEPEDKKLPRDYFYSMDEAKMKQRQEERSKVAKSIYDIRVANQDAKEAGNRQMESIPLSSSPSSNKKVAPASAAIGDTVAYSFSLQDNPHAALDRMQQDLDQNRSPAISDVNIVLKPIRMPRRKEVLRRILKERFQLRGKCVPIPDEGALDPSPFSNYAANGSDYTSARRRLQFVTKASVQDLGEFTIQMLLSEQNKYCGEKITF